MAMKKGNIMNRKKNIPNSIDFVFLGVGLVASYFIYKAVSGKMQTGTTGGTGNTGTGTTGGGSPAPVPQFPTIDFPYGGSYSTVQKWVEGWKTYAIASCVTDCSWRYDILEQTQDKLSDSQIKQVSDGLKQSTGSNMREQMAAMWWFGGPYSNNQATALYDRVQSMSL